MENNQGSFTATTIRKLRKNPLGILSFAVIAVAALVTVFAYFIATDKTKMPIVRILLLPTHRWDTNN